MSFLIEPWTWGPWMIRAFVGSMLVATLCSMIGVLLYLRRLSLLADALSHVALPGIVLSFMVVGSLHPLALLSGAAAFGAFTAWSSEALGSQKKVRSDAAIGVVFTTLFALGVITSSTILRHVHLDVEHMLFGNVLALTNRSISMVAALTVSSAALIVLLYRSWVTTSFDPGFARQVGLPVKALHYGLAGMAAAATMASFDAVGAVLVLGFMVLPAIFAHQFARSLAGMFGLAVIHALASSLVGMYVSLWLEISPAGAMVVVGGLTLAGAILWRSLALRGATSSRGSTPRVRTRPRAGSPDDYALSSRLRRPALTNKP